MLLTPQCTAYLQVDWSATSPACRLAPGIARFHSTCTTSITVAVCKLLNALIGCRTQCRGQRPSTCILHGGKLWLASWPRMHGTAGATTTRCWTPPSCASPPGTRQDQALQPNEPSLIAWVTLDGEGHDPAALSHVVHCHLAPGKTSWNAGSHCQHGAAATNTVPWHVLTSLAGAGLATCCLPSFSGSFPCSSRCHPPGDCQPASHPSGTAWARGRCSGASASQPSAA